MTDKKPRAKPFKRWVTPLNKKREWPEIIAKMSELIDNGFTVTISPKQESRSDIQNRLMHLWCGQIAKHMGYRSDYVFGMLKLDILLPMKNTNEHTHEIAKREHVKIIGATRAVLRMPEYKNDNPRDLMIEAAFESVRSKNIGVELFSDFMREIQQFAAEGGLVLESNRDELARAMGAAQDERAAA